MPHGSRAGGVHRPRTAAAVVTALATAIVAAAIAGCGGSGDGTTDTGASVSPTTPTRTTPAATTTTATTTTGTTPDAHHLSPTEAVNLLLTSSDAHIVCSSGLVTSHYLHAAYGGRAGCVKAVTPGSAAKGLPGLVTRVKRDKATVTVPSVSGGIYDGEGITVALVRSASGWQVDGIKSNAPVGP